MSFEDDDYFQEMYHEWMDLVNESVQLMPNTISLEVENAMRLNQQLINHVHNIRRHLELRDLEMEVTYTPVTRSVPFASTPTPTHHFIQQQFAPQQFLPQLRQDQRAAPQQRITSDNVGLIGNLLQQMITGNASIGPYQDLLDVILGTELAPRADLEDVKVVLSKEEFAKLPTVSVTPDELDEYGAKECNVCIESYKEGDTLTKLPCQHLFHTECIEHWLCNENVKCPVCRHDTRQIQPSIATK